MAPSSRSPRRAAAPLRRTDAGRARLRQLHDFLKCGILAHGFCRVHCDACGKDELVALSCKHRGFCPACGTRRMADTAAWLVDRVFPEVPVRQWVLALPYPVRFLCAFDPPTARGVRRIFVRAVSGFYAKGARRKGIEKTKAAVVVFEQRFDQALRLNLHYHGLWVDGTFACSLGKPDAGFHPVADVTDAHVERLVRAIRTRVLRFLRRTGKLTDEHTVDHDELDASAHHLLGAAAVQGRIALGPHAGAPVHRLGQGSQPLREFSRGPLCAAVDGFSLHAAVRVPARATERVEKLQLDAPYVLHVGRNYQLDVYSRYGPATTTEIAFPFLSAGTANIPFPPFGTIGIDVTQMIALPAFVVPQPAGVGSLTIPIPNHSALAGVAFYTQAVLDQQPVQVRLTNVVGDITLR